MKISQDWPKFIHNRQPGWIYLTPEDSDDIWTLYNLIGPGDEVEAATMRRVVQENSQGDVVDSHKIKIVLAVIAEKIDIDIAGASLRVNGKNVRENKHVKLGSYHTIDLEPEKQLKLSKNEWDSVAIAYLRQAANEVKADLGAIIVQEGASLAFICTLNPSQGAPRVLERVALGSGAAKKANNPYGGGSASEKQQEKFYNLLHESIKRHLDCSRYKAIVLVVGPRTGLETVYTRLMDLSSKEAPSPKTTDCKSGLADNKSKIVKVPVSLAKDAHPDALCSVLSDPRISALLANTKSAIEARMMDQLCKSLHVSEDSTAVHHGYGTFAIAHVEQAAEAGAIKHLLIADRLFRSCQVEERKRYARLIGTVDANGGSTVIVGSDGLQEELMKLSGVAAILHFPILSDEQ